MNSNILYLSKIERPESTRTIESTIISLHEGRDGSEDNEKVNDFLDALCAAVHRGEKMIVPIALVSSLTNIVEETVLGIDKDDEWFSRCLILQNGEVGLVVYTGLDKTNKTVFPEFYAELGICELLKYVLVDPNVDGIIFNPWDLSVFLPRDMIMDVLEECSDYS